MYRLIIADDEEIECRALEHKIKSLVDGVEVLPSVYDGISLLKSVEKYHPDIAIVDINMPGLNGLETIELLKMKKIDLKMIINTAYSDFLYMQKALQLGASDYLLKPGSKEDLAEALRKVCACLDKEGQDRSKRDKDREAAESLYRVAAEKWLLSLLLGQQDEKCYRLLLENCADVAKGGVFTAWRITSVGDRVLPDAARSQGILLQRLSRLCTSVGIEYKGIFYLFLIPPGPEEGETDQEWVSEAVEDGIKELKKEGFASYVGSSRYKAGKEQFVSGLYEARLAMQGRDRPGLSFFHFLENEKTKSVLEGLPLPSVRLLTEGKVEECVQMVSSTVLKKDATGDMEALRVQAAVYILELEQESELLARQGGKSSGGWLLWEDFRNAENPRELAGLLEKGIQECYGRFYTSPNTANVYIEKALLYIYENYAKDISLEDTAGAIGISSFYLSRLFKQEKNLTFVEILTDVRIRRAVQMMRENRNSMKEICQSAGYSNMTYFYKVFKKTTGLTVGEMKKYL